MTAQILSAARELRSLPRVGPRAVVPTMGALHEGHAELVRQARSRVGRDGTVVVTVFVNPTQFGAGEDFERYPRTLADDAALAGDAGADIVFAPSVEQMYGSAGGFSENSVTVDPGWLGDQLEGAHRPGHFRGVLTVVAKFFALTQPDLAFFGEKDYQQLVLVRRMVSDLCLPIDVVGVATIREADGLARSSRNRYLSADERALAELIPVSLHASVTAASHGAAAAEAAALSVLATAPEIDVDYVVVRSPDFEPAPQSGEGRVLLAARIGKTRLIDNVPCRLGA